MRTNEFKTYLESLPPPSQLQRNHLQTTLQHSQKRLAQLRVLLARHNLPTAERIHYARERRHLLANGRTLKSFLSATSSTPPHN